MCVPRYQEKGTQLSACDNPPTVTHRVPWVTTFPSPPKQRKHKGDFFLSAETKRGKNTRNEKQRQKQRKSAGFRPKKNLSCPSLGQRTKCVFFFSLSLLAQLFNPSINIPVLLRPPCVGSMTFHFGSPPLTLAWSRNATPSLSPPLLQLQCQNPHPGTMANDITVAKK